MREHTNGHITDSPTVADILTVYLSHARPVVKRTEDERARILGWIARDFGDRHVHTMRPADLVFWMANRPEWKSDWTRMRITALIRRPFIWAARMRLIDRDPFDGVSHPPGNRGRPMTDAEFRTILRSMSAPFRRVLFCLRLCGMRSGEAMALEWQHIDAARQCALMPQHKTARTRKDRRPRLIVFHPVAWRLVQWIRRKQRHPRFVFLNGNGDPWRPAALHARFFRLRKRIGLPKDCRLHGARHAFCQSLAMNHVGLATIAELAGHTTVTMARYYVDLYGATDHLRAAVQKAGS